MTAPIQTLVNRLKDKGFWRPRPLSWAPRGIDQFLACPVKDLILRFRTIMLGFVNFYSFADNISSLGIIYYILRASLQRTICNKLGIGIKECLARYGPNVTINIQKRNGMVVQLDFKCPPLRRSPANFQGGKLLKDPLNVKDWKVSTLTALGQCCANCGTSSKVEMHHLKHLKTMNSKLDSFGKMMARINRKQVPLCRPCHLSVHRGSYAGFSLRYFKFIPHPPVLHSPQRTSSFFRSRIFLLRKTRAFAFAFAFAFA